MTIFLDEIREGPDGVCNEDVEFYLRQHQIPTTKSARATLTPYRITEIQWPRCECTR